MTLPDLDTVKRLGLEAGLTAAGTASLRRSEHGERLDAWLRAGAHGSMEWMARTAERRKDPRSHWTWAEGALVGALSYLAEPVDRRALPALGRHVARYARGRDYHDELKERLLRWAAAVGRHLGRPFRHVALVDTSAVPERELAVRAGLGWIGRNTCLIGPGGDSWRFLGVVLTALPWPDSGPPATERCGTCRACLDACPTGAITEPFVVDARRCISYLTIEHRGAPDPALAAGHGDWLFGCDVCQEVCPWNRHAAPAAPAAFADDPRWSALTLADLLRLDEAAFRERFRGSPLARPKRAGLLRNAMVVAANTGDRDALDAARALVDDPDPVVRETARAVTADARVSD